MRKHARRWLLGLGMAAALAPLSTGTAQAEDGTTVSIPFERYELSNGLDVILSEDHSVPYVWVNIWYDVGSKDEEAGRTGFAHLFEHLMFQGSAGMDDDYFVPLQRIGAQINGTTSFDRTNYFEGVPAEYLPLALWMESDRMGWLLPALTEEKLQNQKDVVRNERRQRYENRPYGMVWVWLFENLYPEGHPYHVPTIGKHEDLEAATMADVQAFFQRWYAPNNASLSIVGDFDPAVAKALVEQSFGAIPRVEDPVHAEVAEVRLAEEVVVRKEDDVPHAKVWIAWTSPKLYGPGDAELDILSSVLSSGKDSRLYAALVRDQQIAKDVEAYQYSARIQGQYIIEATAAEGHTTDELVAAIDKVLAKVKAEGPTDREVTVAKTNAESSFYGSMRTISGKADRLNSYNTIVGDPGYIGQDLQRYLAPDAAAVQAVAKDWLGAGRVVLHVTPASTTEEGQ